MIGEGWDTEPCERRCKRVITAIVRLANAQGHWGDQSWAPMLGTVMGWVSLRAAHYAGIKVGGSPDLTAKHLVQQMQVGLAQQQGSWMHTLYKNATGIRVLYALGMDDEPIAKRAFSRREAARQQRQHGVFAGRRRRISRVSPDHGNDAAKRRRRLGHLVSRRSATRSSACKTATARWTGHHCITSRTFCTAAAILVLTAPIAICRSRRRNRINKSRNRTQNNADEGRRLEESLQPRN